MRTNPTARVPSVGRCERSGRARPARRHVVAAVVIAATGLRAQEPARLSPAMESYTAHIAAAEAALARNATGAVRRWLDAVPAADRAFEWRMLDAAADESSAAFDAHAAGVSALAVSPDGAVLATGGNDGVVKLWNASTFELVRTIEAQRHTIHCLSFDAEGRRLASSSADRGAKVWDATSGELLASFTGHAYPVSTIRFSPDGARVCSTSYQRPKGGEVRVWDAASGKEIAVLQSGYAPMTCSHWSHDGSKIVAASWDQHLHVFDLAAPEKPLTARLGAEPEYRAAQASALSPGGDVIAVACKDDTVHLFEAWAAKPLRDLVGHRKIVEGVAFSPDGSLVASVSADSTVRLWNAASGGELATLRGHRGLVRAVVFAAGSGSLSTGGADGTVRRWDVAAACAKNRRFAFAVNAYHVEESPDGRLLAVGFANGDLRILRTSDGSEAASFERHDGWIGGLRWSPDGARLVTAGEKRLVVIDVAEKKVVRSFAAEGATSTHGCGGGIDAVDWTADGKRIAAIARDQKVRCWQAETGALEWTVASPGGQGRIEFAADGSRVATCGEDDRLALFDVASRTEVWSRDLKDGYCLAWSRDGERLWFLPLTKEIVCFDARPLRDRAR